MSEVFKGRAGPDEALRRGPSTSAECSAANSSASSSPSRTSSGACGPLRIQPQRIRGKLANSTKVTQDRRGNDRITRAVSGNRLALLSNASPRSARRSCCTSSCCWSWPSCWRDFPVLRSGMSALRHRSIQVGHGAILSACRCAIHRWPAARDVHCSSGNPPGASVVEAVGSAEVCRGHRLSISKEVARVRAFAGLRDACSRRGAVPAAGRAGSGTARRGSGKAPPNVS